MFTRKFLTRWITLSDGGCSWIAYQSGHTTDYSPVHSQAAAALIRLSTLVVNFAAASAASYESNKYDRLSGTKTA